MSATLGKPSLQDFERLEGAPADSPAGSRFRLDYHHLATCIEAFGDFVAASVAISSGFAIYRLLRLGRAIAYSPTVVVFGSLLGALVITIMLDRNGVYRRGSGILRISETERILRVSAQAFLLFLPVIIFSARPMSRWILALGFLLVPLAITIEKQLLFATVRQLHLRGRGARKAIIYGAGFTGRRVFSSLLCSRGSWIRPVCFVDDDLSLAGQKIYALGYHRNDHLDVVSGPITTELMREYGANMLVIAIPSLDSDKMVALAEIAGSGNAELTYVPGQTIQEDAPVNYVDIDGIILATVGEQEPMPFYDIGKRALDLCCSLIGLVLLSPLFLLLAAAVRLDSDGPVFFHQQRVGKGGRLFDIYKFRTMHVDAPKYGYSPKVSQDKRITRLGTILRKASLDELPQLLNVIKGDMSMVGPRPEMPFIVASYGQRERRRLSVIPGITGLWQLSADRAFLIHESPQYDLFYIRNRGFFLDLAILLHTVVFAVRGV